MGAWGVDYWPSTKYINVKIDAAFGTGGTGTDKQALIDGISSWNSKTCSNVSFYGFESISIPDYSIIPPEGTLYVMKHNQAGLIASEQTFNNPDDTGRSAKIQIRSDITNAVSGSYFFHLAAHETGHSFNLWHPTTWGSSVMGGHSHSNPAFIGMALSHVIFTR